MTHKGTSTFIAQRASAVLLIPLTLWFLFAAGARIGEPYAVWRAFFGEPLNAFFAALLLVVAGFHMRLGMNEIVDDYAGASRGVFKLLNLLATLSAVALGLMALYRLAA
jgi:succinate dehydrogenase / fumarate reductase membrane anchor subunit